MSVTSTTLAGVNVWQLSGAVTDAELKAAWSALVVNNRYKIGRSIYVDSTASLTGVRGSFYVDMEANSIILHTGRNKDNTVFNNFEFVQTVGLSVGSRNNFVRTTNGTTITTTTTDGVDMKGGAMIYAVVGNPGGGDPRYLNEMIFGSLDGTLITSAAFTEQEIEPTSYGRIWKGLSLAKVAGFPILGLAGGTQRQVVYRSSLNSEGTQRLVRPYYNNSVCYVSSYITRNGAAVTSNLMDTYGSTGSAVVMILNSWKDESWFGASKTNFTGANWNAGNRVIGGVMKKVQVQPSTLIRTYDSRSTTASQKSTFSETTSDFLSGTDSTTSDASTGRAQFVCVGAIATGSSIAITRYTGQKFTLQKFGYRVQVETPAMTFGDDDLSAFSPITMTTQNGLLRSLSEISAASSIESYQDLLEELHALAITLVGAPSYGAAFGGNLFELSGSTLITSFTSVLVDSTAAQKISYNSSTGALVVRSTALASSSAVSQWSNATGAISTANGATITGVYADIAGQRVRVFGLDPESFGVTWYLRYRIKGTTTWTNITGTGNQTLVILSTGVYEFQARVSGYEWDDAELDTSISLSLDMALRYHVSASNTPQWEMSFTESLSNIFQFDTVSEKVSVANTTTGILSPGFAELYRATQRIMHLPDLAWTWVAPVTANSTSQKILIPTGNPISMFLTDASTNTVKITCPVIHADTGQSADDRVRGNSAGYSIILGSPATAESAGLASQIISSLGGAGFDTSEHGLSIIEDLMQQVKTLNTAIKGRTDLIPDEPATAASVDALGTPLQADSYTAPANADIASIKATVEAMEPTDLTGIPAAVRAELSTELGRMDVAVSTRSTLQIGDAMTLTTSYDPAKSAASLADIQSTTVSANIVKVNNVPITGTGVKGSEWGPAS